MKSIVLNETWLDSGHIPWGFFPFAVGVADSMAHQIYQGQALRVLVALASLTDPVPHAVQEISDGEGSATFTPAQRAVMSFTLPPSFFQYFSGYTTLCPPWMFPSESVLCSVSPGGSAHCCIFPYIHPDPLEVCPDLYTAFSETLPGKTHSTPFDEIVRKSRSSGGFSLLFWYVRYVLEIFSKFEYTQFTFDQFLLGGHFILFGLIGVNPREYMTTLIFDKVSTQVRLRAYDWLIWPVVAVVVKHSKPTREIFNRATLDQNYFEPYECFPRTSGSISDIKDGAHWNLDR